MVETDIHMDLDKDLNHDTAPDPHTEAHNMDMTALVDHSIELVVRPLRLIVPAVAPPLTAIALVPSVDRPMVPVVFMLPLNPPVGAVNVNVEESRRDHAIAKVDSSLILRACRAGTRGHTNHRAVFNRHQCIIDFAKLPVETAWGPASLNPTAVAASKLVAEPVWTKPPDPPPPPKPAAPAPAPAPAAQS